MARTRADLTAEALEIAGAHLRARRLSHAAKAYQEVLRLDPENTSAMLGLGGALMVAGRMTDALPFFARTLDLDPGNGEALTNRGIVYMAVSDPQAAERDFRAALDKTPEDGGLLANLAGALARQKRMGEAAGAFDRALELAPDSAAIRCNYARALYTALSDDLVKPDSVAAVLDRLGALVDEALALEPERLEALVLRGAQLIREGRAEEALAVLDRAILLHPDDAEGFIHKGHALMALGRWRQAAAAFDLAAPMAANRHLVELDAARCWVAQGDFEQALSRYARSLAENPVFAVARREFAQCLTELGRLSEAQELLEKDAGSDPAADALLAALHRMTRRDGDPWGGLAATALGGAAGERLADLRQRLSTGQPQRVVCGDLIPADIVLLAACLPELAARGGPLTLEAPADLVPALARLRGVTTVTASGDAASGDAVPLAAVPAVLDLPPYELPRAVPYLAADPARPRGWPDDLFRTNQRKVGLVWRRQGPQGGPWPSIGLDAYGPLLDRPDWHCFSLALDLGDGDAERLRDRGLVDLVDLATDTEDLLALLEQLDLVVGPDGFVTRLAAAAGRPVALLLPLTPHWIWGRQGDPHGFFPTATLYRQSRNGDWSGPLGRVIADIDRLALAS